MNEQTEERRDKRKAVIRWLLIMTAAGFIVYGALRGEVDTVISKAVRVCMECVGIG